MSPLSTLLTDLAHDEERVATAAHDGPAELRAVLADARRAGRRRLAATLTASAAAVALAVTAATVLPEPVDRAPAQQDEATAAPSPAPSGPAGPTAGPTQPVTPDVPASTAAWGLVEPYPGEPHVAWTAATTDLVPGSVPADAPRVAGFGGLAPSRGSFVVAAGGTWVVLLGSGSGAQLVAVDAATGERRWSRPLGGPGGVDQCAGTDTAGQLVCLGTSASGASALQVLDATDGAVVREVVPDLDAGAVTVSGDVAVVHGYDAARVERWTGISTRTGEPLWSGSGSAPVEDTFSAVAAYGDRVVLGGLGRQVLDARSGEPVADDGEADTMLGLRVADPRSGVRLSGDLAGALRARDAQDGTALWERPDEYALGAVPGTVLVRALAGEVVALDDRTGASRWSVSGRDGSTVDVVASDGSRVVLAHHDADRWLVSLSAVDAATGATVWTSARSARDVLVVGGRLLLDDGTGTLTALAP